jgi:hypothetical protein
LFTILLTKLSTNRVSRIKIEMTDNFHQPIDSATKMMAEEEGKTFLSVFVSPFLSRIAFLCIDSTRGEFIFGNVASLS